MKIRTGFVSNSSSSSFIVAFDKTPESVKEVKRVLFGDEKEIKCYNSRVSTIAMAEIVFRDITRQNYSAFNTENKAIKSIAEELERGLPEVEGYDRDDLSMSFEESNKIYGRLSGKYDDPEAIRRLNKELKAAEAPYKKKRKEVAKEFVKENKGKAFYIFEYSDNDGEIFSTMEHGGIFDKLKHIRVCKH